MKLFIITLNGLADKFIVAADQEEAFDRRGEVDPAYDFLPVEINEFKIEGYEIKVKKKKPPEELQETE